VKLTPAIRHCLNWCYACRSAYDHSVTYRHTLDGTKQVEHFRKVLADAEARLIKVIEQESKK
jgi:hypothetical protein